MRKLETGNEGSVEKCIEVWALDEPGPGGACHEYDIVLSVPSPNNDGLMDSFNETSTKIKFQKGAIHEAGINGITNESLLAVVIDRLNGFANGPFKNAQTMHALNHCRLALEALEERTKERAARGVEGKHVA